MKSTWNTPPDSTEKRHEVPRLGDLGSVLLRILFVALIGAVIGCGSGAPQEEDGLEALRPEPVEQGPIDTSSLENHAINGAAVNMASEHFHVSGALITTPVHTFSHTWSVIGGM